MKKRTCYRDDGRRVRKTLLGAANTLLLTGGVVMAAQATEPCDDIGECKVLVEINSSDGDIGFHWLVDADDLNAIKIFDADGAKIYENKGYGPMKDQKLTETFGESSEPVCRDALKEEEDDIVVTIEDFVERWPHGQYTIKAFADDGEKLSGGTPLSYYLPAAPTSLDYTAGTISWAAGTDLGECATEEELDDLTSGLDPVLPIHPESVEIVAWEVVLDLEDGSGGKFSTRLPPGQLSVTLPSEFLDSLEPNTPAKIEVGAFGGDPSVDDDDNATFTELGDLCLNEMGDGCKEEQEE